MTLRTQGGSNCPLPLVQSYDRFRFPILAGDVARGTDCGALVLLFVLPLRLVLVRSAHPYSYLDLLAWGAITLLLVRWVANILATGFILPSVAR